MLGLLDGRPGILYHQLKKPRDSESSTRGQTGFLAVPFGAGCAISQSCQFRFFTVSPC